MIYSAYVCTTLYVLHFGMYVYIYNVLCLLCTGLRDSNIGSIKELFKLAFIGRPKLFHYVSSLVSLVCTNPTGLRNEDTQWAPIERCVHVWYAYCMFVCTCVHM